MNNVIFKPFVGENYASEELKILVLGESHYSKEHEEESNFTINTVKSLGQRINGRRHRYFTTIAKVLTGKIDTYLHDQEAYAFWNRVAFYNYVQGFVGNTARVRPTKAMFENSKSAFEEVLDLLKPNIVIVTGKQLERELIRLNTSFKGAEACFWYHPASPRYFKKNEALRIYEECVANFKKKG